MSTSCGPRPSALEPEIFLTDDGSLSLRSARFGDAYHSTHGAIQESRHIYLEAGLMPLLEHDPPATLHVLELGFGTGLNALLTREVARRFPTVDFTYTTYERYPVDPRQAKRLNYADELQLPTELFRELHESEWGRGVRLDPNFVLHKVEGDFLEAQPGLSADVIYYDAFAPETQPELWTEEAMVGCAAALREGGVLVTYCAQGQFKRNLRGAGFRVEALAGPSGKREITRAYHVDLA